MALLEVHVIGDAHGIPVQEMAELGKAVPKGWLFGDCGVHPYCFLFKAAGPADSQVGFSFQPATEEG